ncbi:MAG: hypothetical protein WKG07_14635 [Hymenobacter sp.]
MKPVVRLGLRVFFRRLEVRHRERLRLPGPLMLCGNHPNTLMDPLRGGRAAPPAHRVSGQKHVLSRIPFCGASCGRATPFPSTGGRMRTAPTPLTPAAASGPATRPASAAATTTWSAAARS